MTKKNEWEIDLPPVARRHGGSLQSEILDKRIAKRYEELMIDEGRKRGLAVDIDTIIALYAISQMDVVAYHAAVTFDLFMDKMLVIAEAALAVDKKSSVVKVVQRLIALSATNMMSAADLTQGKLLDYIDSSPYPPEKVLGKQQLSVLEKIFGRREYY